MRKPSGILLPTGTEAETETQFYEEPVSKEEVSDEEEEEEEEGEECEEEEEEEEETDDETEQTGVQRKPAAATGIPQKKPAADAKKNHGVWGRYE